MGADLYIDQIYQANTAKYEPLFEAAVRRRNRLAEDTPEWKVAQAKVSKYYDLMHASGYFRDSYNVTNVLNTMGLSWWQDVVPMLNTRRELPLKQVKILRDKILAAKQSLPTKKHLQSTGINLTQSGEESLTGWHQYFTQKREEFIAFLDQAIDLKARIRCSL